jgi:hypothetical protein
MIRLSVKGACAHAWPGRDAVLVVYSLGDSIRPMLEFYGWIVLALAIWLLVVTVRNPKLPRWVKGLLILALIVVAPLGIVACLAVWFVMRSRYPRVWESSAPLSVVTGPAEVHRLDGSIVIVEAGERYEP